MSQMQIWQKPVFFHRNRVFRVYLGGKLFHDFMGDLSEDNFYPEEWIASAVRAINPGHTDPLEGVSILEVEGIPFTQMLEQYPQECLGGRRDLGVLIKFLDSAIRLPMQVHPTRANAHRLFNSRYGKTEAWLILLTRPDACLYFGFSHKISRGEFERAVDRSQTENECMTEFVNRVPVKPGDVFLVPAGVIHAIGAGCMLLEAQEPTDFTIQPEHWCGEYHLSDEEMYLGLKREEALECFDFDLYGDKVIRMGKRQPKVLHNGGNVIEELLIGPEDTPASRWTVQHCLAAQRPSFSRAQPCISSLRAKAA
jgi:mannose-6-phosphate isomerase